MNISPKPAAAEYFLSMGDSSPISSGTAPRSRSTCTGQDRGGRVRGVWGVWAVWGEEEGMGRVYEESMRDI